MIMSMHMYILKVLYWHEWSSWQWLHAHMDFVLLYGFQDYDHLGTSNKFPPKPISPDKFRDLRPTAVGTFSTLP